LPRQQCLNNDLRIICVMAKKIDEAEVKKECPSCGLGVSLDATICEFCGWDFQEEDEWILQIEKLERELLLEKQKFEPGSVEQKIESTLHTPVVEMTEMRKAAGAKATEEPGHAAAEHAPAPSPAHARESSVTEVAQPPEKSVRTVRQATAPELPPVSGTKVRKVRTVKVAPKAEPEAEQEASAEQPRRTRLVRKVKQ